MSQRRYANKYYRMIDPLYDSALDLAKRFKHLFLIGDRKALSCNRTFKNSGKGKRCFILGNGPSLKLYDLSVLKGESVYCVNEFFRTGLIDDVSPDNYFLAEPRYFLQDDPDDESKRFIESIKNIVDAGIGLWVPLLFKKKVTELFGDAENIYFYKNNLSAEYLNKHFVSFDKCIPGMQAVLHYAILHAVYSGFDEIYLLGAEQTDVVNAIKYYSDPDAESEYAFKLNEKEKAWKIGLANNCTLPDKLYGYARIFELYDELSDYCSRMNVKIYNCSPGSLIKSIPYKDWKELYEDKFT